MPYTTPLRATLACTGAFNEVFEYVKPVHATARGDWHGMGFHFTLAMMRSQILVILTISSVAWAKLIYFILFITICILVMQSLRVGLISAQVGLLCMTL